MESWLEKILIVMKKLILNFQIILCLILAQSNFAQQKDSLRYEVMLNGKMLSDSLKNEPFINDIAVSPNKYITLVADKNFYMLGWGGLSTFGNKADTTINAFSYTTEGLLMAIKNDELCFMNELGNLDKLVKLPSSNMKIASGKEVMYLFEQNKSDSLYPLFAFAKGGKYKQLLVSPKPITAVVEMKDSIYLAIGSGLFSFSPKDGKLNLIAGFQKENVIKSMAVDLKNYILYIATKAGIYALKDNSLVFITSDFSGSILKFFNDGLIVFNPETYDILRIVNIGK
ncbi:MAG: hypothetical protein COX71_11365, partial [Flavobacteriales bacterium CG_4_10_14_0_2_um_filter_35_18]